MAAPVSAVGPAPASSPAALSACRDLIFEVDRDANAAGERAARELEARWLDAGREVRLLRSDDYGDLNDIIAGDAA